MNEPTTPTTTPGEADTFAHESPVEGLAEAVRQRDDYLDQLRRSQAELINFRKRMQAQADADKQYAVGGIARDLLAVLDNFDRALESARAAGPSDLVKGLELVHRQFLEALGKHGVEPIPAAGHPFDPNHHEALLQQPSAEHPEGMVVAEFGRGYRLGDRVLRPSKVSVSVRPPG